MLCSNSSSDPTEDVILVCFSRNLTCLEAYEPMSVRSMHLLGLLKRMSNSVV